MEKSNVKLEEAIEYVNTMYHNKMNNNEEFTDLELASVRLLRERTLNKYEIERLQKELEFEKSKNNEVREYIEEHKQKGYRTPMSDDYEFWNELDENEIKELLEILDKEK